MRCVSLGLLLAATLIINSCGETSGNSVEAFLGDWHRPPQHQSPIGTDLVSLTISRPSSNNPKVYDKDRREKLENFVRSNQMSLRGAVFVTVDYNYVDPKKRERESLGVFVPEANIILAENLPGIGLRPQQNAIVIGWTHYYKSAEEAVKHSPSFTVYPGDPKKSD